MDVRAAAEFEGEVIDVGHAEVGDAGVDDFDVGVVGGDDGFEGGDVVPLHVRFLGLGDEGFGEVDGDEDLVGALDGVAAAGGFDGEEA